MGACDFFNSIFHLPVRVRQLRRRRHPTSHCGTIPQRCKATMAISGIQSGCCIHLLSLVTAIPLLFLLNIPGKPYSPRVNQALCKKKIKKKFFPTSLINTRADVVTLQGQTLWSLQRQMALYFLRLSL